MIIVYGKPACVQCTATTRQLDARGLELGVDYKYVDLTEDTASYEMLVSKGYRQAPIVDWNGDMWAGFRPDLIGQKLTQVA